MYRTTRRTVILLSAVGVVSLGIVACGSDDTQPLDSTATTEVMMDDTVTTEAMMDDTATTEVMMDDTATTEAMMESTTP